MEIAFSKMHGIGNDVVVIDARALAVRIDGGLAERIASRNYGVGCDQVMVILDSDDATADIGLAIFNNDGSPAGACGNGTRCVADLLLDGDSRDKLTIAAPDGIITAWREDNAIAVDMGAPKTGWQEIPLANEADTLSVDLGDAELPPATMVNMGNPHAVHFVDDAEAVDVATIGARLERHEVFPDGANIEFASLDGANKIRMRVWERGAGETAACGSGACATLVAAVRRGLLASRRAEIILGGGTLDIEWCEVDRNVIMRGPSTFVFSGVMKI